MIVSLAQRLCLGLAMFLPVACSAVGHLEMAVTFDDLPLNRAESLPLTDQRGITADLLAALIDRGIPSTGFVNEMRLFDGDSLMDGQVELLRLWLGAGQDLGNHTYSHPDLHRVGLVPFLDDIVKGERVTRPLAAMSGRPLRYFRHPFLHTGRDLETKHAVESFLAEMGYKVAPVTVDNSEWIFARAYDMAIARSDNALRQRVGQDYVDYMMAMVEYYESQSLLLFERRIRQVLLLHANRINADWFGRLADRLTRRGYRFITLDRALEDPVYQLPDRYTGPGGITWIHRWAITRGTDPALFEGEPEAPDYVLDITSLQEHSYQRSED